MNRKIKALGLALVAAFAMSAVTASAASAIEFHAGGAHTLLNGSQTGNHSFTVGSGFGAITCKVAKFTGTTTKTTEASQVITPEYKECTDSFGRKVDVTISATYEFTPPASATAAANVHVKGSFTLSITNAEGKQICHVEVNAQTNNNIVYHNVANGDVEVTTTTNNVTTTTAGGVLNCGVGNGHHAGGSYTGDTLLAGTDTAGNNVNISVS